MVPNALVSQTARVSLIWSIFAIITLTFQGTVDTQVPAIEARHKWLAAGQWA
jgi:hypothetical protein